jgi:hypothetical protein
MPAPKTERNPKTGRIQRVTPLTAKRLIIPPKQREANALESLATKFKVGRI